MKKMIMGIVFLTNNVLGQSLLFLEIPEKLELKLNSGDQKALSLFHDSKKYDQKVVSPSKVIFLNNYFYIDKDSKHIKLSLLDCDGKICLEIKEKHLFCKFKTNEILLDSKKTVFLMASDSCTVKGSIMRELGKITTLTILNKKDNRFTVTGSLLISKKNNH